MERGDLSNAVPMRWIVTWEECIARLPERHVRKYKAWASVLRWHRALEQWDTEPHAVHVLTDLAVRMGRQFDVVTHLGEGEALEKALADRCEADGVPASRVQAMSRDRMQRELVHRPEVIYVLHGGPFGAYGGRGLHVDDPSLMQRLL